MLTGVPDLFDSNDAQILIDSAHVQLRQTPQDFAYSSLTGVPDLFDSNDAQILVDSAYVQLRQTDQDFAYGSLTGAPTTLSTFDNDEKFLDSAAVQGVIDATYVQANQITYSTIDFTDSAYVATEITSAINNLIDGAPGALDTLNELAAALGDDSDAFNTLLGYITDLPDSAQVQQIIDQTYIRARQITYNTSDFLDSSSVSLVVDATYVQARQTAQDFAYSSLTGIPDLFDSSDAQILVDSSYVQLRQTDQDFAYSSLTGVPVTQDSAMIYRYTIDSARTIALVDAAYVQARQTLYNTSDFVDSAFVTGQNVSTFTNDAGYLTAATVGGLDSALVTQLIDSAHVQLRQTPQDFAYGSLTGVPTTLSTFTNDTNYLDSATVTGVIDATYVQANQTTYNTSDFVDSVTGVIDATYIQTNQTTYNTSDFVDSAYVEANSLDSERTLNLIDSAYVQLVARKGLTGGTGVTYNNHTGDISIGQPIASTDSVTFSGLTVSGNLTVAGTQSVINTEVFKVIDPLIHLGDSNINSDIVDIGFIGKYYADGQERHTGLVRDANDGEYYLYTNSVDSASDSVNNINLTAPGFTLATLNAGTINGNYAGFDSDFTAKSTSDLSEGTNLYYTDGRVTSHVDAAYVQARQTTYNTSDFTDSAYVLNVIPKTGVDFADSAWIVSQIPVTGTDFADSAWIVSQIPTLGTDFVDSGQVTNIVNASYVQGLQTTYNTSDFTDSAYVTGLPVSTFTNDAGYLTAATADGLDSALVTQLIDGAYVQARQTLYNTSDFLDSSSV